MKSKIKTGRDMFKKLICRLCGHNYGNRYSALYSVDKTTKKGRIIMTKWDGCSRCGHSKNMQVDSVWESVDTDNPVVHRWGFNNNQGWIESKVKRILDDVIETCEVDSGDMPDNK